MVHFVTCKEIIVLTWMYSVNWQNKNVFCCNSKVKDGVAKLADTGMSELENLSKGIIIARPMYTAPEVLDGQLYTLSADIFSLAIMAWEMWYGRRVFSESVYVDIMTDYSSIKVTTCMQKNQCIDSTYMFLLKNVGLKKKI